MEQARANNVIVMPQQPKRSLPPEQRGTVSAGPFSTD
jgi:hypothetical protein